MNQNSKQFLLILLTIALIIGCIITMVQESQASEHALVTSYETLEANYTTALRALLSQEGYRNCGISLTKVYTEEGGRDYTVQVHHHRISRSDDATKEALLRDLTSVRFPADNCTMHVEILEVESDFATAF
ncbi:MAG: hypothetical protein K6G23_08545 [Lachnospiraceae bacterium]|nr:hypothetical protein [Lachnospiraceae bacterium]